MSNPIKPENLALVSVKDMSLHQLSWTYAALTEVQGIEIYDGDVGRWQYSHTGARYWASFRPYQDWSIIGPRIDEYDVQLKRSDVRNEDKKHMARPYGSPGALATGPTKLIAVVRAIVYMHLDGFGSMLVPSQEYIDSTIKDD